VTFPAPLDPKAPVAVSPVGVGGIGLDNVREVGIDRRTVPKMEPTFWTNTSVVPWGCLDAVDWQVAEELTFRLDKARPVNVGASARSVGMGDPISFRGLVDGKETFGINVGGHGFTELRGGTSLNLSEGWHRVTLCARHTVQLLDRSVSATTVMEAAPECLEDDPPEPTTDPDTGDDDACIGCGRPLVLSDEEIVAVRAMLRERG
jgi:hypothetical protein